MSSSYLALGYECNHNCICCPLTTYDRLHKRFSYEDLKKRLLLIRQEDDNNHIVLSGGEPMLHPNFLNVLELLAERDFYVTVLSNASKCSDQQLVKSIKEIMPKNKFDVITAIHSSTPAIHDRITGKQGSLLETLEGIDNLVEEKIPITIKHIFNSISIYTLMDTFKYLEEHYPPEVSFQFCTMDYSGRAKKHIKELFVSVDDIQKSVEQVLDYLETRMVKKRKISFIETPLCLTDPYYWKYYNISLGNLDNYIAPNTNERQVDYDVKSECNALFEICQDCAVQNWCPGIWESAYEYDKYGMLRPIYK